MAAYFSKSRRSDAYAPEGIGFFVLKFYAHINLNNDTGLPFA